MVFNCSRGVWKYFRHPDSRDIIDNSDNSFSRQDPTCLQDFAIELELEEGLLVKYVFEKENTFLDLHFSGCTTNNGMPYSMSFVKARTHGASKDQT